MWFKINGGYMVKVITVGDGDTGLRLTFCGLRWTDVLV